MAEAPDHRISDAERDEVVERLRVACAEGRLTLEEFSDRVGDVYQARTGSELDRVTVDLPAVAAPPPTGPRTRWIVGVFSGARQSGPWRPDDRTYAVAVFGSCQLDLTDANVEPDTVIVATTFCGGIEVLVPQGVRVELGGFALFGGRDDRTTASADRDGPVIRVSARAVFGGVTVRTRPFR